MKNRETNERERTRTRTKNENKNEDEKRETTKNEKTGGSEEINVSPAPDADPIAGKPKTHHFPPYSRAGGRIHPKTRIFGHPQRKSLLHESREPYPCHTFRSDTAKIFTPKCNFEATHAQRCNSCRSGACPNVQIPYPCRLRRRQEHPKKPAIITAWPESGLVRLAKRYASQPHAGAPATPGGKRRDRAKRPPPPRTPQYAALARENEGSGPGGWPVWAPAPSPWSSLSYY